MPSEWVEWHRGYEEGGPIVRRLRVVQQLMRLDLDARPAGPIRVLSLCAGDGRDLIEVLANHPRKPDVQGLLVDLDPELVDVGRGRLREYGLANLEFRQGDAGACATLADAVPADLLLACGIFGNVSDATIRAMVGHLPGLLAPGATVFWTRGTFPPDLTPAIRSWFGGAGFEESAFVRIPGATASVGAHTYRGPPGTFDPKVELFAFLPAEERPAVLAGAQRPPRTP